MMTMSRKLILLLLAFLPLALQAGLATGSWKFYPAFGDPDRLIDTPQFVYLATSGSLHSYDKKNDESRVYAPGIDRSSGIVKDLYYNYDDRYLLVTYEGANIDILPDEGGRINLPDIRDANVGSTKEINDVKFADGKIYVATSFGLVIYDGKSFEVAESGIYNIPIVNIGLTPDNILLVSYPREWTYYVVTAPKSGRHHTLDKFNFLVQIFSRPYEMVPLGNNDSSDRTHFAVRCANKKLYHLAIAANNWSATLEESGITNTTSIFTAPDGVYAVADGKLIHFTAPWEKDMSVTIPEPLAGSALATTDGLREIWAADISGLGCYRLGDDGSVTVTRDRYRPADATTFSDVAHIVPLPADRGFIIHNRGLSGNLAVGNGDAYDKIFSGNVFEDGSFSNIEATEGLTFGANASKEPRAAKGDHIFSPTFALEDPDDSSIHYIGSGNEGVYVVKDGRQIGKFDDNSLIHKQGTWAWRPTFARIDSKGNLLVGVYTTDASKPPLIVLPADKRRKDPATVTADDWVALDMGGDLKERDNTFHLCRKLPIILMIDAQYYHGFSALYYGSSVTDPSDDTAVVVSTLTDQDGKTFSPDYLTCFAEDSRGSVWVGTNKGVMEITNPAKIFTSDFTVNHLKVPRNDGTNLADYLLDTEKIYAIAVDAADRKWIGTAESGLYLVSENGDEIIANFNTSNSPLSTNCISDLYMDPNSNSLFIATLDGLYEYSTSASPGRPDYSDVLAYPNPVTPDYTGLITIRGLMDSSLVKIMDSGMHLVYQTQSEGGMATWDGCNLNGSRVKSGVYYVLASVSSDTDSQGDVVAKILVVN